MIMLHRLLDFLKLSCIKPDPVTFLAFIYCDVVLIETSIQLAFIPGTSHKIRSLFDFRPYPFGRNSS